VLAAPPKTYQFVGADIILRSTQYTYDFILMRVKELWPGAIAVNDSNEYFYGTQAVPAPGAYGYDIYQDSEQYVQRTIDCGEPTPYLNVRIDGDKLKLFGDPSIVDYVSKLALWKRP